MELYTIGYEGLSQDSFLALLQRYEISVVADVRRMPLSRKKGFSKSSLFQSLSEQHIEYLNYRELGTSKEMRCELKETGDYPTIFSEFKKSIADKNEPLDDIYSMVCSGKKVALLCYERQPQICHRKIVAETIKERDGNGLKIKHLTP
jgi:uncharacterized protein (DUF488 family)